MRRMVAMMVLTMFSGCQKEDGWYAMPVDGGEQPVIDGGMEPTGDCSNFHRSKVVYAGYTIETWTYYAVFELGLDPRTTGNVFAWLCESECLGRCLPQPPCPGLACEESGERPPEAACTWTSGALTAEGSVMISCGSRSVVNYDSEMLADSDSGSRARKVYLRVE